MQKPEMSLTLFVKTVMVVSMPSLFLFCIYVILGIFSLSHLFYAYIAVLLASGIFVYPFLNNSITLADYLDDMAQDRKTAAPYLSVFQMVGRLPDAIYRFNRSWEKRKQQMENVIIEREILVDTIPDILLMLDQEFRIVRTNRAARLVFGQNLGKKHIKDIVASEALVTSIYQVAEDLKGREIEFRIEEPMVRDFRAIIERFPVPSVGGITMVMTFTDITELKRGEQMRADFVANASHEIRTPLTTIIGFIETMQGMAKDDPEAQQQFLKLMGDQAQRMQQLVNDLLTLSKVEVDTNKPPMLRVDIGRVVKREVQHFQWAAQQKSMKLRIDAEDKLPHVKADEGEIAQVVHNLVGNAIKYGAKGTDVTVSLRVGRMPGVNVRDGGQAVHLSVRDKGEGIPKEHIPRLTERFYRVDTARTRKVGGTGLGLAIVKHIVTRHKGVLTIDSVVGKGSVFSVYIPTYEEG